MTSRAARLNVKIFIARSNFLLGCRKVKRLPILYLVDSSTGISWTSPFVILGVPGLFCRFYSIFDRNPVSKHCRPDQTPHYVASDLGLHCLPTTLLRVSKYV